jgi:hypothetical protein
LRRVSSFDLIIIQKTWDNFLSNAPFYFSKIICRFMIDITQKQ